MSKAAVEALVTERPLFHPEQWGSSVAVSRWLYEHGAGRTLETGAGYSTVSLLAAGGEHVVIAPAAAQRARISDWCAAHALDVSGLTWIDARSQDVLPTFQGEPLDLVLIDGWHGFPIPMIDWFWTAPLLRIGGYMVVDDTQIRPVRYLADYLDADPAWRRVDQIETTAVFEKVGELSVGEWHTHPHSARPVYTPRQKARRMAGKVKAKVSSLR